MRLFSTLASADWKGRPDHRLKKLADVATLEEAVVLMNTEVFEAMVDDLVCDAENENDEADEPVVFDRDKAASEFRALGPDAVKKLWERNGRFEMNLVLDCKHREFAWTDEGDTSSLVYHLLDDDFQPVPGF